MRKFIALFAVLTFGALAAACGSEDSETSTGAGTAPASGEQMPPHNDADVSFAQGMIPHHAQAVAMADMALDASRSEEVVDLAERIKAAQQPEIEQMTGWLDAWGEPVDAPGSAGHDGHSDDAMGGMMSEEEMAQLGTVTGAMFDQMWLDMMIRHHMGAIDMARTHQAEGEFPDALTLGKQIIAAQEAEIAEMRGIPI